MKISRRLAQWCAATAAVATAATMAVLPAPAVAAAADVAIVVQVKIDDVGTFIIEERRPGAPAWQWIASHRDNVPLNEWVELQFSLPVGSTVYIAENNSYYGDLHDDETIVVTAGQTHYTVDLTGR